MKSVRQYEDGKIELDEVCERLKLHRSSVWRKCQKLEAQGPLGLIHGLRGKTSNFREDPDIKKKVCDLFEKEYKPYGYRPAHFYQDALEQDPTSPSYPSVLRWLKSAHLIEQSRKGCKHHSRRPRREAFGEMLQMDTSIHDWLGWNKNIALISNIDDCTSHVCGARLQLTDTTLGNMTVIKETIITYGLFGSLYVDRSAIFKVTRTGGIGRIHQPTYATAYTTQVQRALSTLGIKLIYAYSPQAKGRVERGYQTWQTRLVPELRKNGITDLDKANLYIQEVYLPRHNERFAQDYKKYASSFIPINNIDLDLILAEKYELTIGNDHIVSSKQANLSLKILPSKHRFSYAKARVEVFRQTNGSVHVFYQGDPLNFIDYTQKK